MQIEQTVEIESDSIYIGWYEGRPFWNGLEVSDGQENSAVNVELTDEQYIRLADSLNYKVARIKKDRREKLQKELEEMEDAKSDS